MSVSAVSPRYRRPLRGAVAVLAATAAVLTACSSGDDGPGSAAAAGPVSQLLLQPGQFPAGLPVQSVMDESELRDEIASATDDDACAHLLSPLAGDLAAHDLASTYGVETGDPVSSELFVTLVDPAPAEFLSSFDATLSECQATRNSSQSEMGAFELAGIDGSYRAAAKRMTDGRERTVLGIRGEERGVGIVVYFEIEGEPFEAKEAAVVEVYNAQRQKILDAG